MVVRGVVVWCACGGVGVVYVVVVHHVINSFFGVFFRFFSFIY